MARVFLFLFLRLLNPSLVSYTIRKNQTFFLPFFSSSFYHFHHYNPFDGREFPLYCLLFREINFFRQQRRKLWRRKDEVFDTCQQTCHRQEVFLLFFFSFFFCLNIELLPNRVYLYIRSILSPRTLTPFFRLLHSESRFRTIRSREEVFGKLYSRS